MVTILAVRADWVGAKLVTETHAGIRRGCICHSKAKAVGAAGGPGSERFDQPLLDIFLCSCLSTSYARLDFCPRMS